jgi:hypothetical protein
MPGVPFVATVHVSSGPLDLTLDTENLEAGPRAIWAVLSTKISGGTISGHKTTDGRDVIVNWSRVEAVTYQNPWVEATS